MAVHVVNEARRCLECKKPKCVEGCPVRTPIPQMIALFKEGKSDEAGRLLFENNPLSSICALVCNHEGQCEGNCVQAKKGMAVHWSSIEDYISEKYLDRMALQKSPRLHQSVAIIGAGPAGLTISITLAQKGYDVTLFDSRDKIGGVLRYGIPDFRLPKTLLDKYQKRLREMGIHFRPNTSIGGALHLDDLFRDGYEAVFIGTGVWRPNTLGVVGESLGNVHYAIDYLVNPDSYELGENVIIIGAGNAAIDVARTVIRHGARRVRVCERSMKAAASERELDYALADGVEILYGMNTVKITPEGPVFRQARFDGNGEVAELGEEQQFHADSTIVAISQGPKDKIVSTTSHLETSRKGLVLADSEGHTTREGVFASGDVVAGAKTVVEAVRYSKQVAAAMDEYLTGKRMEKAQAKA
ncbi:MAG: NAD(P)-dependent oxidoreductase [Lachnospiraceae bacterium]|nr:NAD(P)-dependent oxidoreductase [Lachnospiraceae bacterium]